MQPTEPCHPSDLIAAPLALCEIVVDLDKSRGSYLYPDHTQLFAETYKQWHSDGLEFESANLALGAVCVGTWQQMPSHMVSLYHVGWTPGGVPGLPTAVRFVETETNRVSVDGNSYDGTGTQTFYDQSGTPLAAIPLYIQATRLPPQ